MNPTASANQNKPGLSCNEVFSRDLQRLIDLKLKNVHHFIKLHHCTMKYIDAILLSDNVEPARELLNSVELQCSKVGLRPNAIKNPVPQI